MSRLLFIFLITLYTISPYKAEAILPPDIIFSVGSQFAQFFSLIAVVVGGIAGAIALVLRTHLMFLQRNIWRVVGLIFFLVIIVIFSTYYFQERKNEKIYVEHIKNLQQQLEKMNAVITTKSTSTLATATAASSSTWETLEDTKKIFNSNTIHLYGNENGTPFYLELDLNRRQTPSGLFQHYYYIVSSHQGLDSNDYQTSYSSSTEPVPTGALLDFERRPFSDLSTREEYYGRVNLDGKDISFEVKNLSGDFITRNTQAFTRFQSVGEGEITYNNNKTSVYGLVEGIHSSDFSKSIFFEGSENITATTRQFVLWDEFGNFYMIDQSKVESESPAYTSHTWLLHKNKKTGSTQKSFSSDITARSIFGKPETGWTITANDFDNAVIEISLLDYIDDGDSQERLRALVTGKISDDNGTRNISGFGFIIK
jgi:hypothetical protein